MRSCNIKDIKFSISGLKNILDKIYSQIDMTEGMISDLENISIEIIQALLRKCLLLLIKILTQLILSC